MEDDLEKADGEAQMIAESFGLVDKKDMPALSKIYEAFQEISEKHVDSAYGSEGADYWATINDREYFITVTPSNKQKKDESH